MPRDIAVAEAEHGPITEEEVRARRGELQRARAESHSARSFSSSSTRPPWTATPFTETGNRCTTSCARMLLPHQRRGTPR